MLNELEQKALLDRFLRYVKIDTRSQENSDTYPSTPGQWDLLNLLVKELKGLGLKEVTIDDYGYVMATIPSNIPEGDRAKGKVLTIGFLAHVDTAPGVSGKDVKPQIVKYQGGDISLLGDLSQTITVKDNPLLEKLRGSTIITSDGTTLLGADDKAGVAEIMTAVAWLMTHPDHLHGPIRIAFTPDEEIGKGTTHFKLKDFGADFAYTLDGSDAGQVECATFCADTVTLTLTGYDVHPGYAYGKMINAVRAMAALIEALPQDSLPETTKDMEGYLHPIMVDGDVSSVTIKLLVRDFTEEGLLAREDKLQAILQDLSKRFPGLQGDLTIDKSYRNMKIYLDKNPKVVDYALEAVSRAGLKPIQHAIRGGTDGARLCEMGLLTPNLFAGGQNFHSKREWVPLPWMIKSVEVILHILSIWKEKAE